MPMRRCGFPTRCSPRSPSQISIEVQTWVTALSSSCQPPLQLTRLDFSKAALKSMCFPFLLSQLGCLRLQKIARKVSLWEQFPTNAVINALYISDGIAGVITVQPISKTVGCWWWHVEQMVRGSLGLWFIRMGATSWDNAAYVRVNYGLPNPPRGVTRHNCLSVNSSKLGLKVGEDQGYVLEKSHPLHQSWNATSCAKSS